MLATAFLLSCGNSEKTNTSDTVKQDSTAVAYYAGDTITADGAIPASEIKSKMGSATSMNMKVEGVVHSCCQKKGCWTEVAMNDSETIHVTFKDYGFFVPKDASGKTIIMEGVAKYDTTSVDMRREIASDAGQSKEEIEKITEPEYELVFEASGIIVK